MILEPNYTIDSYKYGFPHGLDTKEGYQWYDIDYNKKILTPFANSKLATKSEILEPVLFKNLQGLTALDLGCNKGYFSYLAHKAGAKKVTAIDVNHKLNEYLVQLIKIMKWQVDPICKNLFAKNFESKEIFDCVMCLAMIHEISNMSVEEIIFRIRKMCAKMAIIEFCEDYREVKGSWWNFEFFREILLENFSSVTVAATYRAAGKWRGNRYILECFC